MSHIPHFIPSFANEVVVHFYSNGFINGRGFHLRWYIYSNNCGGNLEGPEGVISSPLYPNPYINDAECEWKIHVPDGSIIRFIVEDLSLEYSSECHYDSLEIFDGFNLFKRRVAILCNDMLANDSQIYTTTTNKALVRFTADDSNRGRGFLLKYTSQCQVTLTSSFGFIESVNYNPSGLYAKNDKESVNCSWTIKALRSNNIQIEFIAYSSMDDREYILLQDGNATHKIQNSHFKYTSSHDVIQIVQTSNLVKFQLEYKIIGCVQIFNAKNGNFSTPNYPKFYNNDIDCFWSIFTTPNQGIELTIDEMDIEQTINCTKDSLIITSHPDQQPNPKEYYCGRSSHLIISSASHRLYVRFHSDASGNGRGISASYRVIKKRKIIVIVYSCMI